MCQEWFVVEKGQKMRREVDILLGDLHTGEQWVEAKSWKAKSLTNRKLTYEQKPWHWAKVVSSKVGDESNNVSGTSTGSNSHKQFNLDRISHRIGAFSSSTDEIEDYSLDEKNLHIKVINVVWSFHKFKTKLSGGTNINPTLANIKSEFLKPANGVVKKHLTTKAQATGYLKVGQASVLLDVMATELADAIKEDIIDSATESF